MDNTWLNNGINIQSDIIYDEGCPFQHSSKSDPDPCTACNFQSLDRTNLTPDCADAIENHCRRFFKEDRGACLDFPEQVMNDPLGGNSHCEYTNYEVEAFETGIKTGRDGKGTIFVFSSSNGFSFAEDINFLGYINSRYTISVGAVAKSGKHANYSTAGAALLVSAPAGGDYDTGHLLTAGLGDTCTDSSTGTSFSAPVVSGVIALMLEANPDLSWRDVQGILATTSQEVDDDSDDTDKRNAAGFWHSNLYGFGIVDAKAAVDAAKQWNSFTEEKEVVGMKVYENAIELSDNEGNEFESIIKIDEEDVNAVDFVIESTVIKLVLPHYNRGDLKIELKSPSGTTSVMHPGNITEDTPTRTEDEWEMTTVRNWGESPIGEWTLTIRDLVDRTTPRRKPKPLKNEFKNEFKKWDLVAYGRTSPPPRTEFLHPPKEGKVAPCLLSSCWTPRNRRRRRRKNPPAVNTVGAEKKSKSQKADKSGKADNSAGKPPFKGSLALDLVWSSSRRRYYAQKIIL